MPPHRLHDPPPFRRPAVHPTARRTALPLDGSHRAGPGTACGQAQPHANLGRHTAGRAGAGALVDRPADALSATGLADRHPGGSVLLLCGSQPDRLYVQDQHASTDELYAVGASFTLLAWVFAHLYSVCQLLLPGSFTALLEPQARGAGWSCCSSASPRSPGSAWAI